MCKQIDYVFSCGHRSFAKFDNCVNFGNGCFGANGNHLEHHVANICKECEMRKLSPQMYGHNDPYRQQQDRGQQQSGSRR